ncbi:MAG TPA: molecular chaperone TorD family protein [Nitrospirota bacterium]|nr:molecular chaperone TorD family protein [Nitrospirota bacterium]
MNPYRYFSLIFSYPTEENRRELGKLSMTEGVAGLHSAEILGAVTLEELQAEYTRLYISAYPTLLCPPYESYYREGIVYGNSSVEVGEWYQKRGLDFTCEGEPADVVKAELEFLAITNDGPFLKRMKEWIFKFTQNVKLNSTLYGPCADELEAYLMQQQGAETAVPVG